jgi:hypothetical protein
VKKGSLWLPPIQYITGAIMTTPGKNSIDVSEIIMQCHTIQVVAMRANSKVYEMNKLQTRES